MKRLLALLLAIALLAAMAGCSKAASDEKQVSNAVSGFLKDTFADPLKMVEGDDEILATAHKNSEEWQIISEMMKRTRYEIGEPVIEGDSAQVEVTFSSYDIGKAYKNMLERFTEAIIEYANSGKQADVNDLIRLTSESWKAALGEQEAAGQIRITPFTIALNRTPEGWQVNDYSDNQDFLGILVGGLYSAVGINE